MPPESRPEGFINNSLLLHFVAGEKHLSVLGIHSSLIDSSSR